VLQVYNFGVNEVRTVLKNGEIWLVGKDVCDVLEISNSRHAISRLDEDEKASVVLNDGRQHRHVTIINEAGLNSLIFGSKKPEAKEFKRWITHEVIPAIRKTGSYSIPQVTSNSEIILMLAQQNVEMEKRQLQHEQKLLEMQNFLDENVTDRKKYNDFITVTTIAKRLGLLTEKGKPQTQLVNKVMFILGIQERVNGKWVATTNFEKYTAMYVEYGFIRWSNEIVPIIADGLSTNSFVFEAAGTLKMERDMALSSAMKKRIEINGWLKRHTCPI